MAVFRGSHLFLICFLAISISLMFDLTLGDATVSANGIYAQALGQSGQIRVGRTENPARDPNGIVIDFDSIIERGMNNETVGQSGQSRHSFQSFASLDFTFSEIADDQFQSLSVRTFTFSSMIESVGATIEIDVYIFTEDGDIVIGDENTSVSAGNVKFNIQIRNWTFCGGSGGVECRQGSTLQTGMYLDVAINIKGRQSARRTNDTGRAMGYFYGFGGNSSVLLSKQVQYDGSGLWENMPGNYPLLDVTGNKQSFVFRFERFNSSVWYDPTIILDDVSADSNPSLGSITSVSAVLILFSFVMQMTLSVL